MELNIDISKSNLVKELREKGHKGTIFSWGKNLYLWDETDEVVYNYKTERQLKWNDADTSRYGGYIFLCDGGGDATRCKVYRRDFKDFILKRSDNK